jgi:hypothetical protein
MAIVLRHWSRRFAREGARSGPSQGNSDPGGWLAHDGTVSDLSVAIRSSIRSRSTSQYLSEERRRLCGDSNWVVASSCALVHRIAL